MQEKSMRLRHAILLVLPLGMSFSAPLMAGSPEEVFRQVASSIVVVEVSGAKGEAISFGSGVIIAPGQVITNCHVIKDGKTFTIRQSNQKGNQPQPASLRYQDIDRDLCQLDVTGFKGLPATITISKLKTGQRVYAIGAPQGLELTISEGLISSLRDLDGAQYIQTTAAISPGSSGGGLFDENGQLIGITTFYFAEGQNLNFALPAAWIAELPKRAVAPLPKQAAPAKPATDSVIAWMTKAWALEEKQDGPGLLAYSKKWVKARPGDADAWYWLGNAYGKLNQHDRAIDAYREALRIDPEDVNAWYDLGATYSQIDQTDKAIEAYREALRIDPEHSDVWYDLGATYGKLKQYDKAIEAYREALRIDPEHADVWYDLGATYGKLKQYDKEIAAYLEALRINPEDVNTWYYLGITYGQINQTDKEIDAYRKALRINPKHTMAWYFLGFSYSIQGNRGKVREIYQTLRKLDPERAERYFNALILP